MQSLPYAVLEGVCRFTNWPISWLELCFSFHTPSTCPHRFRDCKIPHIQQWTHTHHSFAYHDIWCIHNSCDISAPYQFYVRMCSCQCFFLSLCFHVNRSEFVFAIITSKTSIIFFISSDCVHVSIYILLSSYCNILVFCWELMSIDIMITCTSLHVEPTVHKKHAEWM